VYLHKWSQAAWDSAYSTNFDGPISLVEQLLPHMEEGASQRYTIHLRRIRDSPIRNESKLEGGLCLVKQLLPHTKEGTCEKESVGNLCKLVLGALTSGWRMRQLQSRAAFEASKACGKTISVSTAHIRKAPWQAVQR